MDAKKFSLPELELKVMFHVKHSPACTDDKAVSPCLATDLLVVAGGRAPQGAWLRSVGLNRTVYAADSGAACCLAAGIVPKELFGDCDSTTQAVYDTAKSAGTLVHSFNPAKDDTDLQLLLQQLPAGDIIASGIWGGRFDHLYSNVFTLLGVKQKRECQVLLADEKEFMLLLAAGEQVEVKLTASVEALSLLPLTASTCVDFKGVHWELNKAELKQLYPYAISNVPAKEDMIISCTCHSGAVGLYIRWCDKNKIK